MQYNYILLLGRKGWKVTEGPFKGKYIHEIKSIQALRELRSQTSFVKAIEAINRQIDQLFSNGENED